MAHIFFSSYARLDNNRFTKLDDVVTELRERVRARLGYSASDEVGFFDGRDICTGAEWVQVLGAALRQAKILVCFCSPTYFNSEYCAKEFEIFQRRLNLARPPLIDSRTVIPVIWEVGVEPGWIPSSVARYQYTDQCFPKNYARDGLCVLRRVRSQRDNYKKTLDVLAETIAVAASKNVPPWPNELEFEKLPQSFHNPGPASTPYGLVVVVLNDKRMKWTPANDKLTIARTLESVTSSLKIPWREIPFTHGLIDDLKEAQRQRQAVILLTDLVSVKFGPWKQILSSIDQASFRNCAVLVGLHANKEMTSAYVNAEMPADCGKPIVDALIPRTSAETKFHDVFFLESPDGMYSKLKETITKIRMALIRADPAEKVRSPEIESRALSSGIPIESQPIVNGPGGV